MRILSFCMSFLALFPLAVSSMGSPVKVGVSVLPLESIVQEIGGDAVEVRSLQEEGDSCSVFEPRPSAITWLASAEVFFRTGVGYESTILEKIKSRFPRLAVYDLRDAVELLPYEEGEHDHSAHEGHGHQGGAACAHCGSGVESDPHIWLDPLYLLPMADLIAAKLTESRPDEADLFKSRAAAFKKRALAIHAELEEQLHPYRGRGFYIYHPALGYFSKRYGLVQSAIAGSGQSPSARELHRLVGAARQAGVRVIFVQPQESRRHAEIVAGAIEARVVEVDPMSRNWDRNLEQVGAALVESFREE